MVRAVGEGGGILSRRVPDNEPELLELIADVRQLPTEVLWPVARAASRCDLAAATAARPGAATGWQPHWESFQSR